MFDIDTFVAHCRAALRESSPESAVRELVERAVAQPAAVEQALGDSVWPWLPSSQGMEPPGNSGRFREHV